MAIAAKLEDLGTRVDDLGKPAWIALVVLGFIAFWPAGLAILFYLVWSGRMACWKNSGNGRYQGRRKRWSGWSQQPSSGNYAFDEYRSDTPRRLEEEDHEYREFHAASRQTKDKAEFHRIQANAE